MEKISPLPLFSGGALIQSIKEGSPADDAGFTAGCIVHTAEGFPLRDILDWQWYSAAEAITLTYTDVDGDQGTLELERDPSEDWGFEFEGALFDTVKTCRNNCVFCFMRQLPQGVRPSLVLRDDDFRLSFLQGNFVTLTNISPEDEERIFEQKLSPLHVSLHAITPEVRRDLMGKHEARGREVGNRLLDAGIQMWTQIVLVPGINEGEELLKTLNEAYAHPGILGVAVVPLGFTKHQTRFSRSFNEPYAAQQVLEILHTFQEKALCERGNPWVFAADEFYRNAYPRDLLDHLPPASHYGDYAMFEDGIGIIRSTVESWKKSEASLLVLEKVLRLKKARVYYLIGYAQREFLEPLVEKSPLAGLLIPFAVPNEFFGGNVDVTGLLCGVDMIQALKKVSPLDGVLQLAVIPEVVFNKEGLTLDDMSLEDMQNMLSLPLAVVSCNPSEYIEEIAVLVS